MKVLHIANGASVTGTLDPAAVPGDRMVFCDPLHDGPVPGGIPDRELWRIRADFLATAGPDPADRDAVFREFEQADAQLAGAASYGEVVLWYEHDLFDQLSLIQLLERLSRLSPRANVSLISIDRHENHPRFKGLGELDSAELTALMPTRRPVTDRHYETAAAAWAAFRSADPTDLEGLLASDSLVLPFLAPALRRHLEEFPWTTTGLSRREQHALTLIGEGHDTAWKLFRHFDADERHFYTSDVSLWQVLTRLAAATPPLITMEAPATVPGGLPDVRIRLSSSDGTGGPPQPPRIEKWLGGVHISRRGPTWRWHPTENRLIFL